MKIDKAMIKKLDPAAAVEHWPAVPHVDWAAVPEGSPPPRGASRWTRRALVSTMAAGVAAVIAGVVVVQAAGPTSPVLAATPPPLQLQYDANAPAARDALLGLASEVASQSTATEQHSGRFSLVRVGQWSLDISSSNKDGTKLAVVPQVISTWRAPDGSGKITTVSLDPSAVGDQPNARTLTAAADGVGETSTYSAGQLAAIVPEPVPDDADALARALYAHQPRSLGPQAALRGVADLYRSMAVNRDVRVAALKVLASTEGLLLRGQVTDRLGRRGLAVSADSTDGRTRDLLVIDQDTGWLLAYESLLLQRPPKLAVKVPAVFSYVLYLEQGRRPNLF